MDINKPNCFQLHQKASPRWQFNLDWNMLCLRKFFRDFERFLKNRVECWDPKLKIVVQRMENIKISYKF